MEITLWHHLGLMMVAVLAGATTAVAVAVIGGMGVLTALRKRLEMVEISQENLDRRLTTEVKARSSVKAVEARGVAKSLEEQARVLLASESPPYVAVRPTVFNLKRR